MGFGGALLAVCCVAALCVLAWWLVETSALLDS